VPYKNAFFETEGYSETELESWKPIGDVTVPLICAWCGEEISEDAVPWNDDGDYMHPECYEEAWSTPSTYYDDLAWGKQDRPEDRE